MADYLEGADVKFDRTVVIVLALLFVAGLGFRAINLSGLGFAEDEVNKVEAIRAYERGDITANGEHPMLMKSMMFVTVKIGRALNLASPEAWFRFPNAVFGALTVLPLFLLTAAFFDRWTGLLAAAFWAVGVNAIAINRIGKEDTLLVFFLLFACYFYLRAKQTDSREVKVRNRNYLLSGASFGLMIASKYFPHYLGLNSLYHHYVRVRKRLPGEPSGQTSLVFYIALVVAFLIANPAVLLPSVWQYLNSYMGEKLLSHSGYLFADQLYKNNMSRTPFWGTPIYFYLLFMAIKIPIAVLTAFLAGLIMSVKNRWHPGHAFVLFMFLFWIVPYSLVGAKWLRYTLSLMPFVYMFAAIGVMGLIRLAISRLSQTTATREAGRAKAAVIIMATVVFIFLPALSAFSSAPHFALYTNALGAGRVGYYFPHDEFYDDGLREALKFVCDHAPAGATIAHETPAVTRYYLEQFKRTDLISKTMSSPDFDPANSATSLYIIVQRGRTYFENRDKMNFVRGHFQKVHEVTIRGIPAAEVFVNLASGNDIAERSTNAH
jgi:Dolichyl-phosphate-mannose-protein mannosyltransferase